MALSSLVVRRPSEKDKFSTFRAVKIIIGREYTWINTEIILKSGKRPVTSIMLPTHENDLYNNLHDNVNDLHDNATKKIDTIFLFSIYRKLYKLLISRS